MVWGAVIGAAASIGSAVLGNKAAKKQAKAQKDALNALSTELVPFQLFGPGGQAVQFGDANLFQTSSYGTGVRGPFDFSALANGTFQPTEGAGLPPVGGSVQAGGSGGTVPGRQDLFVQPDGSVRPGVSQALTGSAPQTAATGFDASILNGLNIPPAAIAAINAAQADNDRLRAGLSNTERFGYGVSPSRITSGEAGQSIFTGLGDLEPSRQGLVALAGQQIGRAGQGGGVPGNIQAAGDLATQAAFLQPGLDLNTLFALESGAGQSFGTTLGDFLGSRSGFQTGLQNSAFQGATNLANIAGQDPQAIADQRLALLRQQAAPFEERAFSSLQENLFGTGRLGTTGGALQTEAFARGLGQADLERQLAASAEGRAFQTQALQGSQGLAGLGTGVAGLQDQLIQSAFNRFNTTAGLASDLSNTRVNRNFQGANFQQNALQQLLQNQISLAGVGRSLQQSDLNLATQALQAQGGLNDQSIANFQAALAAAQAQANARIGAGSNIANFTSNTNFGVKEDTLGGIFGAIGKNAPGIIEALGGIFGKKGG